MLPSPVPSTVYYEIISQKIVFFTKDSFIPKLLIMFSWPDCVASVPVCLKWQAPVPRVPAVYCQPQVETFNACLCLCFFERHLHFRILLLFSFIMIFISENSEI